MYIGLMLAVVAALGLSAVLGLSWAVSNGQLSQFESGARSIFDEEEPEGMVTDAFPQSGSDARSEQP